jgi:uncharacterized protein (TIGR02266 family)
MGMGAQVQDPRESVTLVIEYQNSEELIEDLTVNLEQGGTFVHTERGFEEGTLVDLVLRFPGLLRPVQIAGEVRWFSEQEGGVGIEFVDFDDAARARLTSAMKRIRQQDPAYVGRPARVLVVDDNMHIVRLIRDGLQKGGRRAFQEKIAFEFAVAESGAEALMLLEGIEFDIVIADLYLPMADSQPLVSHIRKHARQKIASMPIIAMVAAAQGSKEEAVNAGADLFVKKPVRLKQLNIEMASALELARERAVSS